ncbi:putative dipeptidyl-aminopeptidase B [Xylona heveae TC161]|uniref:dipeptidyl-peptidase IV n=1 Tax=Xylona heveae (strain CBS 132557 / TC161) TaxID=1328760 RepID=A0A165HN59_XYLHT|nr:putative dipeptidyl-aminopeptidase B [Xylona heveae TC161]KZF23764.1 putative dipeptidyl-aminopeptidase B [Xylona heveae TC161]
MSGERTHDEEEKQPLTAGDLGGRPSCDSVTSASTTSLILEHINGRGRNGSRSSYHEGLESGQHFQDDKLDSASLEEGLDLPQRTRPVEKKLKRIIWILTAAFIGSWALALIVLIARGSYRHASSFPHDPTATSSRGSAHKVTLDQVLTGQWRPKAHGISWIKGANGEDGLLLERDGGNGQPYLVVKDIRNRKKDSSSTAFTTLMEKPDFKVGNRLVQPSNVWPSNDLRKVLVVSHQEHNWRHSFTGRYWIFDVQSQTGQALDPGNPEGRVQLASWSPQSDAIVFTRENNMFIRELSSDKVEQITSDGGPELFYGVPDWVYEEEVFSGNSATWWAEDGQYLAFLRTNESTVPEYPIQYFVSRPSGKRPEEGQESYPEVREIKYPKAGAPNPIVDLQFYDIKKKEVFSVRIDDDFPDSDRLITEVVWAGSSGQVLIRETNRVSDILAVVLIDVKSRSGKVVRTQDVSALDGGWFEVSQETRYIPASNAQGRPYDGYIDTVIHDNYDHLAYFSPMDNPKPTLLTSGGWEVVQAPSAVDLINNRVYFVATKEGPTQRHVYSVKLDGTDLQSMTDTSKEGYYSVSFSTGAKFALLTYQGPNVPWQKVINTPSNSEKYEDIIEENKALAQLAREHELPPKVYQTVKIDGTELNVVERRPPHFDKNKKYPVLFYLYGGPGSQMVDKKFVVDFQSYLASKLNYIVVTVDGRGTGFIGRKARCIVRDNLGHYESHDQIETAKIWAAKDYVDESRMAIWGWSYGGFMTLKTLEQDAGQTFKYGMAVAPVTDWRFYDSVYTERYMSTPQENADGYANASISNVTALGQNVRFLLMHGVADDNVHMQNSLTLLDQLDLAGIENYDVHVFPDSDHGISFHNAYRIVFDKLNNWLINAFNGEWLRTENPMPLLDIATPP